MTARPKLRSAMESGVRTGDQFDLDKVQRVLELCPPYIAEGVGL